MFLFSLITSSLLISTVSASCLSGYAEWVPGRCFRYYSSSVDYPTAKATCEADGTMMLSIHTVQESDALDVNVTAPKGHFWLGLECDAATQRYIYTDGSETSLASQWTRFPCVSMVGYHHHTGGGSNMFVEYAWYANMTNFSSANTLCTHWIDDPPASGAPATYGTNPTLPPDNSTNANSCGDCSIEDVWLDIMFVVDSSESMQQKGIYDVQANIRTILSDLDMNRTDVRAGIIVYSDKAQIYRSLGSIQSEYDIQDLSIPYLKGYGTNMESAIVTAFAHFSENTNSLNSRRVIVLFASQYREGPYKSPEVIARAFRDEGGVIITIDYSAWGNIAPIPMLDLIASPGYEIMRNDDIIDQLASAFCDANCYCPDGSFSYTIGNGTACEGRCNPTGGCFSAVTLPAMQMNAWLDCKDKTGDLASIHSDEQQMFITTLFKTRTQFWTGLVRSNGIPQWTDGSSLNYYNYGPNATWSNGDCAYSQQYQGFNTGWFPDNCRLAKQYACELSPCTAHNQNCQVIG